MFLLAGLCFSFSAYAVELETYEAKTQIIDNRYDTIIDTEKNEDFVFLAQNISRKPRLGILPFTGAGEDGETIAELFSYQQEILNVFTAVPRTSAVNALISEQKFQMTGYTDSDTIARLGRMLNADYVLSGHIRRLGNRNLVITTIIHVESFEQLAGDYSEYMRIEGVDRLLPNIARKMTAAVRRNTSALPKLAIAPFIIHNQGANVQEAEALSQILAVELINTGKYAVLPRTETIQAAMKELEFQMSGYTAEEEAKRLGQATNARYVLSAEVRSLGTMNMFTASILNVENGSQIAGAYRTYRSISDGTELMKELAKLLANSTIAASRTKPRLGILPFSGGADGDGETIATLFSFEQTILNTYTVVPRTSTVNALVAEQNFQMQGYTDSDTIAKLGQLLNADYVVSGHIRRLGNSNLVVTTIVNVETFELISGNYTKYNNIQAVEALIPEIAVSIIDSSKRNTSGLPKLAVIPFNIASSGVNAQDAETLAQILAVEVVNTGYYAVLPRTSAIQTILQELGLQMSGDTDPDGAKALGRAINAQYVLNAQVRPLGDRNMFTVSIIDVEDGSLSKGGYRHYRTIDDGIILMPELSFELIDREAAMELTNAREKAAQDRERQLDQKKMHNNYLSAAERKLSSPFILFMLMEDVDLWEAVWPSMFSRPFATLEGSNWGMSWEILNLNYPFLPFLSAGIGVGGGVTFAGGKTEWNWLGGKAYLGTTLPLYVDNYDFSIRIFGDAFLEIGYSDWGGLLLHHKGFSLNPGFEAGLLIGDYKWSTTFEITYGITYYPDNRLKQSFGISFRYVPMNIEDVFFWTN